MTIALLSVLLVNTSQVLLYVAIVLVIMGVVSLILFTPGRMWIRTVSARISVGPLRFYFIALSGVDIKLLTDLFIRARKSGVRIGIGKIESLIQAEVNATEVVEALVLAHNAKLEIPFDEIKEHALSGGDVKGTVEGLIAAMNADVNLDQTKQMRLSFHTIGAIDHAGINVQEAIDDYVHPKVVETDEITAVAKDGVELTAHVRITMRTNLHKIISGVDKDTVKSRINERVVSVIGGSVSHTHILQNTYEVGEEVMKATDLWEDAAYNVMSVDIVDLRVGRDVGSELKAKQAESNMVINRAKEQEMKALMAEAEVLRIKAESEVQQAMAEAFRDGHLTVNEYYNMQNKEADTMMRKSFSKQPQQEAKNHSSGDATPEEPQG